MFEAQADDQLSNLVVVCLQMLSPDSVHATAQVAALEVCHGKF